MALAREQKNDSNRPIGPLEYVQGIANLLNIKCKVQRVDKLIRAYAFALPDDEMEALINGSLLAMLPYLSGDFNDKAKENARPFIDKGRGELTIPVMRITQNLNVLVPDLAREYFKTNNITGLLVKEGLFAKEGEVTFLEDVFQGVFNVVVDTAVHTVAENRRKVADNFDTYVKKLQTFFEGLGLTFKIKPDDNMPTKITFENISIGNLEKFLAAASYPKLNNHWKLARAIPADRKKAMEALRKSIFDKSSNASVPSGIVQQNLWGNSPADAKSSSAKIDPEVSKALDVLADKLKTDPEAMKLIAELQKRVGVPCNVSPPSYESLTH